MNFNKAIIAGNITRDPELRTLPSGQSVTNFSVASNRRYTDQSGNKQEIAEFHNVVAFGKWADICSRYLTKGMPILVEGRLQTRSWQGQDGLKRYRTEIVMEFMQMGPKSGAAKTPTAPTSRTAANEEEIPIIEQEPFEDITGEAASEDEKEIKVENIPF